MFAFSDTFWRQLKGMAMNTPVACVVVTLFFVCHEVKYLIPTFAKWIMIFLRCINDGIIIWKVDLNNPSSVQVFGMFKKEINRCTALIFTMSDLLSTVNFLDLTIAITEFHNIIFAPYSKPFHLCEYPP